MEPHELSVTRSNFRAFVGVSPRRYIEYFQMTGDRKTEDGKVINLPASNRQPKFRRFVFSYISVEQQFVREVESLLAKARLKQTTKV